MAQFEEFWNRLVDRAGDLAHGELENVKDEALRDARAVLDDTKQDLRRWAHLVERGELTRDDLAFLVKGRMSVAQMHGLKRAGLALADIDRLRRSLVDLTIDTAFDVFVPS